MFSNRRDAMLSILAGALSAPLLVPEANAAGLPQNLVPTPSCTDDDEPTLAQTEGPYFTPNSPSKQDFTADGTGGEPLIVGGLVLDTNCAPISRALVELWHADADGEYDNQGFRYRGHTLSDDAGRWWFATIRPGLYPGRTRHYHVKVQRPGSQTLTTQLYFPGESQNRRDNIFNSSLVLNLAAAGTDSYGLYNFVLA